MQVLKKWKDSIYRVENTLYMLENDIKLLHTYNENTTETVVSVVINTGAYHDRLLELPDGTTHFLEHMISANPNKLHSTLKQIDLFEFGNKKRPSIMTNAYTSSTMLCFWGATHHKGENRLAKRLNSIIDYPTKNFPKYIEKERKVIIAERNSRSRTEKDTSFNFFKFIFGKQAPNKEALILGEVEDIASIKPKHLERYLKQTFTKGNAIIAVQSPNKIGGEFKKYLEKLASNFDREPSGKAVYQEESFRNIYRYTHFTDERSQGVKVVISSFTDIPKKIDYKQRVSSILANLVISHVAFKRLREKLGLVYYFHDDTIHTKLRNYWIDSFVFACDLKDLKRVIDEAHEVIFRRAVSFLNTKEGRKWFEDKVSRHIYPNTTTYSQGYTENKASYILWGRALANPEKLMKAAENVSVEDVQKYIQDNIQTTPPHVWVVSSLENDKVIKELEKSKLHKYWSKIT